MRPSKDSIHVLARAVVLDRGHLLVCKTRDLPVPFYFLPGGHVELDESVQQTVLRELKEEAGAEGVVERLLGVLEYRFEPGHSSICHHHEYNFIFKCSSPDLNKDVVVPPLEKHIELLWISFESIFDIDFRPEPLKWLLPDWVQKKEISYASEGLVS